MQRVRVGLTGLSCVFLLVLLAAAFFGLAPSDRGATDVTANRSAADNASAEAPKDPLAELGVTPGGGAADTTRSANVPVPAPTPAGAPTHAR